MANANGWGDGASNNNIGWGKGADNLIGWGDIHADSWAGLTDIVGAPSTDPDAQAFITAASITDSTQQSAINTLVTDLKGYGVWSKMKAIYPFVGGTASAHKWNLKDPRDLDAAFRLVFSGGWTHSSTGALPNGTNAAADTFYIPSTNGILNSAHLSYYSRTQNNINNQIEIGVDSAGHNYFLILFWDSTYKRFYNINQAASTLFADTNTQGFFLGNRQGATDIDGWRQGVKEINGTESSSQLGTNKVKIGARGGNFGTNSNYSSKECAFASIGDGLTDTEAANFYTAVQAFQTTLGRSIGTQTVSDADAQAFVTNAGIVDQVEANAVNNLVIGLKADSLWTKMKAVYPFVGGTSTTHKYNLVNPLDTDAAFRLVFSGGWTHSSTGALPNGTNGYADTFLTPSTQLTAANHHISLYSRTNISGTVYDMGCGENDGSRLTNLFLRRTGDTAGFDAGTFSTNRNTFSNTDSRGFYCGSVIVNTASKYYKNGTNQNTKTLTPANLLLGNSKLFLGGSNVTGLGALFFSSKQIAFASIGDGLTDTESANLYTAVQTFQTALNRNV